MQKQNLLKERNGASLKPETQTPSSTLDTAVVVIDKMTAVKSVPPSVVKTSAIPTPKPAHPTEKTNNKGEAHDAF
jgi:hypothetical protein